MTHGIGILETWALGRAARDEYLRFRRLLSHTAVHVGGTLVYADTTLLEPHTSAVSWAGVLDRRRYLVSGFWYGADLPASYLRSQSPNVTKRRHFRRAGCLRAVESRAGVLAGFRK
jgi:urease accessory protein UreH